MLPVTWSHSVRMALSLARATCGVTEPGAATLSRLRLHRTGGVAGSVRQSHGAAGAGLREP